MMSRLALLQLALCSASAAAADSDPAEAQSLASYPLARCLDGSAARYYLRRSASNATRWFIFHEGGGFCTSIADCRKRAQTRLGSTAEDAPTMALDRFYFSQDAAASPLLADANHVFVRYCDGGYFSGDRLQPVLEGGGDGSDGGYLPLYFRGRHITEAVLRDLSAAHGLAGATDIVLGGCSAGAIRVFAHLDALRSLLPRSAAVVGFPDSGFYLDVPMFTPLKRFVTAADGQNATALLSTACLAANPGASERCLVAEAAAGHLATPLFALQSRYDLDQRSCEMSAACAAVAACVNRYGDNATAAMHRWLATSPLPHGAFMDGCSRHCDGALQPIDPLRMRVDGAAPLQALAAWHASLPAAARAAGEQPAPARRAWQQPGAYPCRECCGGGSGRVVEENARTSNE